MNIYLDLYLSFAKVGSMTFGGGYAMLPILQRELVDKKHYATEDEILDYYAVGQCTPGVIAVNTATFVGYKKAGYLGAVFSTLGLITPSICIILFIAAFIKQFAHLEIVQNIFIGIRIAVTALITDTILKLCKKNIKSILGALLFCVSFILATVFDISTIIIILFSILIGIIITIRENHIKKGE